ncbi:MAG: hypothetical protein ABIQ31_15030 [Ferruginibacter sp.]
MNKKTSHLIFTLFAALVFVVALYHIKGIFYPSANSPAWRHAIFVLINFLVIYGLLKRPAWFIWFIAVLMLQQWYSHGSYAYQTWQKQHLIDWISVAIILLLPLLLILLLKDKKTKTQL